MRNSFVISLFALAQGHLAFAQTSSCLPKAVERAIRHAQDPSKSVLKKTRHLESLRKEDPRFAWQEVTKASPTADRIDNFTSPATQELIFRNLADVTKTSLKRVLEEERICNKLVESSGLPLTPEAKQIISDVEIRIRFAAEIVNGARVQRGHPPLTQEEYTAFLQTELTEILQELEKAMGPGLFSRDAFALLSGADLKKAIQNGYSDKYLKIKFADDDLNPDFKKAIGEAPSFSMAFQVANTFLSKGLEQLPVGISLRPYDLTSTVRFGRQHFFGSWGDYESTTRDAYERGPVTDGGIFDAELNLSASKKKQIAIALDRSHKTLDSIFGLDSRCDQHFHTCGSFAPYVFIRHGLPVLSPAYGTPESVMLSLAIQKTLQIPLVKSLRTKPPKDRAVIDVPIIFLVHGLTLGVTELGIYSAIVSAGVNGVIQLYDHATGKIEQIELKANEDDR